MNPEDLQFHLEGWDFEAKKAAGKTGQGGLPENLWETYSAMANVVPGHSRDLTLDLQSLIRKNAIERIGSGRGCSYRLAEPPSSNLKKSRSSHLKESQSSHLKELAKPVKDADLFKKVASSKRCAPHVIMNAILQACGEGFLTPVELGKLLKRKPITLGQKYITALVAQGLLERKFPDQPNHPDQAYRTVSPQKVKP